MVGQFGSNMCVKGGQMAWLQWGKDRPRKEGVGCYPKSSKRSVGQASCQWKELTSVTQDARMSASSESRHLRDTGPLSHSLSSP